MSARALALQVVRDVFPAAGHGRGAQEALDYRLRHTALDARDAASATVLAYGAIKMRRTLDWYLHPYIGQRSRALPPAIAETLRLALYELRFMAAPEHAVVHEWVGLAKRFGHRGTAGLVNAVLRAFLRDAPPPPERSQFTRDDDFLGTAYSYPTWLVAQWRAVFGDHAIEEILRACNAAATSSVVVNRAKISREAAREELAARGVDAQPSTLAQDALVLPPSAPLREIEAHAAGRWWLQSETSAVAVDVLDPRSGEFVADVCSGRGNKALQSAARVGPAHSVVCIERNAGKAALLEKRAAEAGVNVAVIVGDAAKPIAVEQQFDRILIDAPCSGVGVVGRHAEMRWRKRPDDGERLSEMQRALLASLAARLSKGGVLVYAVCSTDPRETTQVRDWFERSHDGFGRSGEELTVPPGLHGRDGFFAVRFAHRT